MAPGFVDTDMTRALPEARREAILGEVPMGRMASPDEIAQTVVFLSERGRWLHHRASARRQRRDARLA